MEIVLVHGFGVSHRYWRRLRQRVPASAPDLAGASVEELAASLEEALPAPAVLVGNSLGCQVAVELAARRADLVRGLVLVGPTWDPAAPTLVRQALRLLNAAYREPPSLLVLLLWEYVHWTPRRLARTARSMLRHPVAERLAQVEAPGVVIRGARDAICGGAWARRVATLARARLVEVPGAAHAVHWSHPDVVQEALDDLVERAGRLEHRDVAGARDQLQARLGDRPLP